jgi:PKD repeat protein
VRGTTFAWTPLTPTAGQLVTFAASATGTAPVTFTWEFGGGSTATGQQVTHTFADTGTYAVTLTAANPCGQAGAVRSVEVVPPPIVEWRIHLPLVSRGGG